MRIVTIAAAAALAFVVPAKATTFDLPAITGGSQFDLGQFTIDNALISSGALDLTRFCATAGSCIETGPWSEVSYTLVPWLDDLMGGNGVQVIDRLRLAFNPAGGVQNGFWLSDGVSPQGAGSVLVAGGDQGNPFQGAIVQFGADHADATLGSFAWNAVSGTGGGGETIGPPTTSDVPEPSTAMLAIAWIIGITAIRSLYSHQREG